MIRVFASDRHRGHDPEHEIEASGLQVPFEHPGRAEAIHAALAADQRFDVLEPRDAGTAVIEAVHEPGLVRFLASAWQDYQRDVKASHDVVPDVFAMPGLRDGMGGRGEPAAVAARLGYWCFETTTPLTAGSYDAARAAVDCAVAATDAVLGGEPLAYGLCRPPGHHAATALYGGYCFFNNAAIAATHAASAAGARVAVLDVDYHHGNGTQQIFYDRDDVQFVSLHGDPARAYPYSMGFTDETGTGRGLGYNVNYPMPLRADDDRYVAALEDACSRIAAFGPSTLVVSLGLDTFITDPISDLAVTTDGMGRCGAVVRELGIPTVVLQEGGYDVAAIGSLVRAALDGIQEGLAGAGHGQEAGHG